MPAPPKTTRMTLQHAALVVFGALIVIIGGARMGRPRPARKQLGPQFQYKVEHLQQTDPDLVQYHRVASIPGSCGDVRAVAVDGEDQIYLAGETCIEIFSPGGESQGRIDLESAPNAVTVAADGSLFVAEPRRIVVYRHGGKRLAAWDERDAKTMFTSVAVRGDDVFAADAGHRIVLHYDREGHLLSVLGQRDAKPRTALFVVPSPYFDVVVDSTDELWVVNPGRHRVERYSADGDLEQSWGRTSMKVDGFSGCCNPVHLSALPDGGFVTSEKGLRRVKVYDADGNFVAVVAGADQFPKADGSTSPDDPDAPSSGGMDLAVDSNGRILVLDPWANSLRIYERTPQK